MARADNAYQGAVMGTLKEEIINWSARMEAAKMREQAMSETKQRPPITKAQFYAIGRDLEAAIEKVEGAISNRRKGDPRPVYRYKAGHSEAVLAAKHDVSEWTVANVRREVFGDLQRSDADTEKPSLKTALDAIDRLTEQLAEAQRRLDKLEDAVTAPAEKNGDMRHVLKHLDGITANGPR